VLIGVVDGRALALNDSADTPTLEITTPVPLLASRLGRISARRFLPLRDGRPGDRVIAGPSLTRVIIFNAFAVLQ